LAAENALEHVLHEMVEVFERSESLIFSQKAADVKDIMMRLKKKLANEDRTILCTALDDVTSPVVVLKELFPSIVIEVKKCGVSAFIVEKGTSFSHAAILSKSFGIPVLKINNVRQLVHSQKKEVIVDGVNGELFIEPEQDFIDTTKESSPMYYKRGKPLPVHLWINIVDSHQLNDELLKSVDGIGLYRTEVLFMKSENDFPSEDEQYDVYAQLFKKCADSSVTIRTLDIGGDKALPYFSFGPQDNPFLGLRAHRIYRFHPEIFLQQIRAILRAGIFAKQIRILYPMIENVDELLFVKGLFNKALESLKRDGSQFRHNFDHGLLVEVPSAVWSFKTMLQYVDFASVGSNDLLQYFFAVDRNNANVSSMYQPENPSVLRMFKSLVNDAQQLNKHLSICGEIASDVRYLPLLIGLGFKHLSIDYHTIPLVREYLENLDLDSCRQMVQKCTDAESAEETRDILKLNSIPGLTNKTDSFHVDHEALCPICKMVVHTESNEMAVTGYGKTYYFCCKMCRKKFLQQEGLR
jgi:phosphoenolpyruvate-protein phosphotransferase